MKHDQKDDELPSEEAERRMNEALKRALNTPPKRQKPVADRKGGGRGKPDHPGNAKPSSSRNRSAG